MKMILRKLVLLGLTVLSCVAGGLQRRKVWQKLKPYPSKDIHLISAFPAGSGADVLVRYFAEKVAPCHGPHGHRRE